MQISYILYYLFNNPAEQVSKGRSNAKLDLESKGELKSIKAKKGPGKSRGGRWVSNTPQGRSSSSAELERRLSIEKKMGLVQ